MKRVALTLVMLLALPLGATEIRADDGHGAEKLGVTIKELVNSTKEWDGQPLPDYPDGQAEIKVLRIRIPAGVTLPWHYLPPCDQRGCDFARPIGAVSKWRNNEGVCTR